MLHTGGNNSPFTVDFRHTEHRGLVLVVKHTVGAAEVRMPLLHHIAARPRHRSHGEVLHRFGNNDLVQSAAHGSKAVFHGGRHRELALQILEITTAYLRSILQTDGGMDGNSPECPFVDDISLGIETDRRDVCHTESLLSDILDFLQWRQIPHVLASPERLFANLLQFVAPGLSVGGKVAERGRGRGIVVVEGITADALDAAAQLDRRQRTVIKNTSLLRHEGVVGYLADGAGHGETGEGAGVEGLCIHSGHGTGLAFVGDRWGNHDVRAARGGVVHASHDGGLAIASYLKAQVVLGNSRIVRGVYVIDNIARHAIAYLVGGGSDIIAVAVSAPAIVQVEIRIVVPDAVAFANHGVGSVRGGHNDNEWAIVVYFVLDDIPELLTVA